MKQKVLTMLLAVALVFTFTAVSDNMAAAETLYLHIDTSGANVIVEEYQSNDNMETYNNPEKVEAVSGSTYHIKFAPASNSYSTTPSLEPTLFAGENAVTPQVVTDSSITANGTYTVWQFIMPNTSTTFNLTYPKKQRYSIQYTASTSVQSIQYVSDEGTVETMYEKGTVFVNIIPHAGKYVTSARVLSEDEKRKFADITEVGAANDLLSKKFHVDTTSRTWTFEFTMPGETVMVAVDTALLPPAAVITSPTAIDLTYNGSSLPLLSPGTATTGGILQYAIGNESAAPSDNEFSNIIPQATTAGTYYVWYYVKGDGVFYKDSEIAEPIEVTIGQAFASVATAPTANSLTYNGNAQALVAAGSGTTGGTLQYAIGDTDAFSTTIPKATTAGSYTVWWKVVADDSGNYKSSTPQSINVTISPGEDNDADNVVEPPIDVTSAATTSGHNWTWNKETLTLTLNGVNISNQNRELYTGYAIRVPGGTTVVLADGSENTICGSTDVSREGLYSRGSLTIEGNGTLNTSGMKAYGGALTIASGTIESSRGIVAKNGDITISPNARVSAYWNISTDDEGHNSLRIHADGCIIENANETYVPGETYQFTAEDDTLPIKINMNAVPTPTPTPSTPPYTGGGSSSSSTVTVPVQGEDNKVNVEVRVSGSTAEVNIDSNDLNQVLSDDEKTGNVEIDLTGLGKEIDSVKIPMQALQDICEAANDENNDVDGLTIKFSTATVTFDTAALKTIVDQAKGKDLQIHVDDAGTARLNTKQKEAVKALDVVAGYEAYVTSDGKRISDFKGGKAKVQLSKEVMDGRNVLGFSVWFIAEDGSREKLKTRFVNGMLEFTVPHFSDYVVAYDEADIQKNSLNDSYKDCPRDNTCPIAQYQDASPAAWYHDGVHFCLDNGILVGFPDGTFQPNTATSRAMIVTMLWRMEGSPAVDCELDYKDVKDDDWYIAPLRWAATEKVATGYGNGQFGPNDAITREQLAAMLHNYAISKGYDVSVGEDTNILSYDDAFDISDWAYPAMQWACGCGMINGVADGLLGPVETATRAQTAVMMKHYIELYEIVLP